MKPSKKSLSLFLVLTLATLLLAGGILYFFYSEFMDKFRYENLVGIRIALIAYSEGYDTALPPLDKWCDKLIEEADCSPTMFIGWLDREEGVCGYALNENLSGLKFSNLDDRVVLAFEAKGAWNLSGESELMKTSNKQKKIGVVFVGRHVEFVKKEDIDKLRWKP